MRTVHAPRPRGPFSPRVSTPATRRGEAGERIVRAALSSALDDRYVLVHGLYLPGGDDAIDAVLIGPLMLTIEIVTYAEDRPLRVTGLRWERQSLEGRWRSLDAQPSARVEANVRRVIYALRSAGLPAYGVRPVVALVGGAECTVEQSRVPILRPAELVRLAREGSLPSQTSWPEHALRALLVAASTR